MGIFRRSSRRSDYRDADRRGDERGFDSSSWREKADSIRTRERASKGLAHSSAAQGNLTNLDRTQTGAIKSTYKNAMLAVARLGVVARRDVFADRILLANAPGSKVLATDHVGQLTDNTLAILRRKVQIEFGFDCGADHLNSAIASLAEEGRFNPLTDWLDRLVWDGVERLKSWLPAVAGAADTELHRYAGRLLVLAMIVRARHPGTKFDICIVLEGPQGSGKSTLARLLSTGPGDSYFGDAPGLIGLEMKARAELLSGKWLVELAELSGLARSEIENVKAFLSQTSDQFRPAYGRVAVSRPRSCVFVATTNSQTYLPDATGNRRFIPVSAARSISLSSSKFAINCLRRPMQSFARRLISGRSMGFASKRVNRFLKPSQRCLLFPIVWAVSRRRRRRSGGRLTQRRIVYRSSLIAWRNLRRPYRMAGNSWRLQPFETRYAK